MSNLVLDINKRPLDPKQFMLWVKLTNLVASWQHQFEQKS